MISKKPDNSPLDNDIYGHFLEVAQLAAAEAQTIIKGYYATDVKTDIKADSTPVTEADKASEKTIKKVILKHFPDHGFYGEEYGHQNSDSDYLWLVDPIDGTKSFIRQTPFFSTQIALMYKGELVLGVSNAPLMNEQAWATKNNGAYINGDKVHVEDNISQELSCVSTGNIQGLINSNWAKLGQLLSRFNKIRGYGDYYHYHLLASGKVDLVVESDINILDIAALTLIVQEAGGSVSQINGKPIGLDSRNILAGSKKHHSMALEILQQ